MGFIKEFREFISRGNVIDLAVGVIIGAAFSAIVNSLVKDIVNPIIGVLVGKPDFTNLFIVLKEPANYAGPQTYEALVKAGATVFGYGAFLTAVIQFLLLAFVIFWMVKIVTGAQKKVADALKKEEAEKKAAEAAAPAPTPEDILLLREIRDELKKK
jgi:large conductance mechanosensitive channel